MSSFVPAHDHDPTTIRSLSETQKDNKNRTNLIDFSTIKVDSDFGLQFSQSDNILDDLCIIEHQINHEVNERSNMDSGLRTDLNTLSNSRCSTTNFGLTSIKYGGGLVVDSDNKLSVDFSKYQEKLIPTGNNQNIKTINGESLLVGDDGATNVDVITSIRLESELAGIKSSLTSLQSQINSQNPTDISQLETRVIALESQLRNITTAMNQIQTDLLAHILDLSRRLTT